LTSFHLLTPSELEQIESGDFVRVGGDAACGICGSKMFDHPTPITIGDLKFGWLRRLCDGRFVKP